MTTSAVSFIPGKSSIVTSLTRVSATATSGILARRERSEFAVHTINGVKHHNACPDIQCAGRFVTEKHFGTLGDLPGDGDALPLGLPKAVTESVETANLNRHGSFVNRVISPTMSRRSSPFPPKATVRNLVQKLSGMHHEKNCAIRYNYQDSGF